MIAVIKYFRPVLGILFVVVSCSILFGQTSGTYSSIDFPGANATIAEGIDSAGDIVGTFGDSNNYEHGFLLRNGVFTQLDVPVGAQTLAYGINDMGQVVGGTEGTSGMWVYDIQTQGYTMYTYANNGYGYYTTGVGINNSGTVVGFTYNFAGQAIGLVLKGSVFRVVRIPGAFSTQLTSINNFGAIVGIATTSSGVKTAYSVNGTKFDQLFIPGVTSAVVMAVNDSDVLVGDYSALGRNLGFEWQKKGPLIPISQPSEHNTYANGVNNAGQVVGYYLDSNFNYHGYLWTPASGK